MKILCIGEALIDMICTDRDTSLSHGTNFLKKAGGAPTNVAAAIAALGGSVELAAKVGTDPFGTHLIEEMKSVGVSTKWMLRDDEAFTTFAFVSLMQNGERDFYFNRGADGRLTLEEVDAIPLDDVAIIHFGSATAFLPGPLQGAYTHLLAKALTLQIFVSFDPNFRSLLFEGNVPAFVLQSWYFLNAADFFKLSDEEALLITGASKLDVAVQVLLEKTHGVFAITLGKDGTLLRCGTATQLVPSIPVNPVDTTGAGDAFVGAVLYQLAAQTPATVKQLTMTAWEGITRNGNKAGARTCEYMGAMEAFRHLSNQVFDENAL